MLFEAKDILCFTAAFCVIFALVYEISAWSYDEPLRTKGSFLKNKNAIDV